jgi:hypothetical protein
MRHYTGPIGLTLILFVAAWLRLPFITAGVPFFSLEDEAHHFQRTVHMVKTGSFNPEYFNKPSLHFYLRMPVVAAAFVSAVKAGEIRRVDQMVTRSSAPRGGWAFTVSHPRILIWNRAFGVLLGLIGVALTFALARELTGDAALAIGAASLAAVSPALAMDAAKVGVDTPMVVMCLLAMWLALRLRAQFTVGRLVAAGLVAGLACSTKYNALPIVALPLVVCVTGGQRSAGAILLAVSMPVAGFLLGTPYALIELPRFLNNMAFETWHYGTAGHGAATGEPGLAQVWFYLLWFASRRGLGVVATLLSVVGAGVLIARRDRRALTFLLFPVLFFALMAAQKVNFTRNVLVLLPVIAVLAAVAVQALVARTRAPDWAAALLIAVACVQPLIEAVISRRPPSPDSRTLAARWLDQAAGPRSDSAAASELGWPMSGPGSQRVSAIDTDRLNPLALYMAGYDRLIVDASYAPDPVALAMLRQEHVVAGNQPGADVVVSPEVRILRIEAPRAADLARWLQTPAAAITPEARYGDGPPTRAANAPRCSPDRDKSAAGESAEGGCWVRTRASRLVLDAARLGALPVSVGSMTVQAELRSPWPEQRCTFEAGAWRSPELCAGQSAGQWFTVRTQVPVAVLREAGALTLTVQEVHAQSSGPTDSRPTRAGLIVRALHVR